MGREIDFHSRHFFDREDSFNRSSGGEKRKFVYIFLKLGTVVYKLGKGTQW
jgi:hypothetical protein